MRVALGLLLALIVAAPVAAQVGEPGALIGRPAPRISAARAHGDGETRLERMRGRVVIVAFFSTYCASCGRAMRELDALKRAHRDLEVLAITQESRERLDAVLEIAPVDFTIAIDSRGETFRRYQARVLPAFFLIDRYGTIRHVRIGGSEQSLEVVKRDTLAMLGVASD